MAQIKTPPAIPQPLILAISKLNTALPIQTKQALDFVTSSPINHILTGILLITLSILTIRSIYKDYLSFLSLGPGGTPPTPLGYLKIKLLSIVSLRNPYRAPSVPPHFRPQTGYLSNLTRRIGKRPVIRGIAPQRQQTERSSAKVYKELCHRINALTQEPKNFLIERTSCFEKHSTGLFTSKPLTNTCRGEICHAHPSDGSMHLVLHPADIKTVIEAGWGERHPLARGGWFRRFVPKEFMMIYAPRNEMEVGVVMDVIAASVWWVSGVDVKSGTEDEWVGEMGDGGVRERECWSCGHGPVQKNKMVAKA